MDERIDNDNEVSELEKALDNAIDELMLKSKKMPAEKEVSDDDEEDESAETEEDEDEEYTKSEDEPYFEALSKSLEEGMADNGDVDNILDAMPLVKAMVDTVDDQLVELAKAVVYLSDKIEKLEKSVASTQKLDVAQAKLLKSISSEVHQIGGTPLSRKSFIGKNLQIMKKSEDGTEQPMEMTKSQAMEGLTVLHKSGKIGIHEVAKFEGFINNGRQLPEQILNMIASVGK